MRDDDAIGRREALKRAALIIGGVLVLPGALAGCEASPRAASTAAWKPRTLSAAQAELVATLGEFIIPETDTPGARKARVHEFIDTVLTDFLPPEPRKRFLAGLERVDQRAVRAFGKPFLQASPDEQRRLVEALNAAAFADADGRRPPRGGRRRNRAALSGDPEPTLQAGEVATSRSLGGGAPGKSAVEAPGGMLDAADVGRESFFLSLKRVVIEGYYTSEVGAKQELRVNPMGAWRADVPYPGHGWA